MGHPRDAHQRIKLPPEETARSFYLPTDEPYLLTSTEWIARNAPHLWTIYLEEFQVSSDGMQATRKVEAVCKIESADDRVRFDSDDRTTRDTMRDRYTIADEITYTYRPQPELYGGKIDWQAVARLSGERDCLMRLERKARAREAKCQVHGASDGASDDANGGVPSSAGTTCDRAIDRANAQQKNTVCNTCVLHRFTCVFENTGGNTHPWVCFRNVCNTMCVMSY